MEATFALLDVVCSGSLYLIRDGIEMLLQMIQGSGEAELP